MHRILHPRVLLTALLGATNASSVHAGCRPRMQTCSVAAHAKSRAPWRACARDEGLALAGKTALWRGQGNDLPSLAMAWGLQWLKPAGDNLHHAGTELSLVYSHPLAADWPLHANLGRSREEMGRQRSTSWALAREHAGFGSLAPLAEVFGNDREAPWWNLGLRWSVVPERMAIDISYRRQMACGRPKLVTLGFKLTF